MRYERADERSRPERAGTHREQERAARGGCARGQRQRQRGRVRQREQRPRSGTQHARRGVVLRREQLAERDVRRGVPLEPRRRRQACSAHHLYTHDDVYYFHFAFG